MHGRTRYLEALESTLDSLHRPRFSALWEGPVDDREWGLRERIRHHFAVGFAVLDAFRDTPDHGELATRFLLDFDSGNHFTSLHLGTAYELLRDALPPADRADFGERWVADARSFDHLPDEVSPDEIREWDHVTNHTLCACFYADYARHLFPEESEAYDLASITDPVWRVWWDDVREFHEQASNYEGFSECYLAAWADRRGVTDAFYDSPTIRNMLERGRTITSPAGIVSPYGDSGHLDHLGSWIALFEKVASETGDGTYRRAASDVFEYVQLASLDRFEKPFDGADRGDLARGRQVFGQHSSLAAWLAVAALWTDPTLAPAPRPDPDGRIRRVLRGYELETDDVERLPTHAMEDCQVALTGGPADPGERRYVLLSIGPRRLHDHADAGAIQLFGRGPVTLLGTNGYLQQELIYHHAFYAQPAGWDQFPDDDPDRVLAGDDDCRGTVATLESGERTARCRLTIADYHGLPLDLEREVILGADGTMTVRDRVTADETGYRGGPLFHAESIEPVDERTFDLRTDVLRSMNGVACRNPAGVLRVTFLDPEASPSVTELDSPSIYDEVYTEFPTTEYREVWEQSYTARQCLSAPRALEPADEPVFAVRLEPRRDG